jgi:hypothetical protein
MPKLVWHEEKANANLRKHGIGFDEAGTVFADSFAITISDPQHSVLEDRFIQIGVSPAGRLLVVVYTERDLTLRIISARRATKKVRVIYEQDSILQDDMLQEYDLSGGVRGKYYHLFQEGYSVTIYHADGSSTTRNYAPEQDMIKLEPDVKAYFPDSESVNRALRGLIALFPPQVQATK